MFEILLGIFTILAIADNALTLYGIKHLGLREKNPIMRLIVKIPWLSWLVVVTLVTIVGLWCYWICGFGYWYGVGLLAFASILKSIPVIKNLKLHIGYHK